MTTLASVSAPTTTPVVYRPRGTHHHNHRHDDDGATRTAGTPATDGPGRRTPLVNAMMSALRSLMPSTATAPAAAAAPATPATPGATATPATATTAADPAATLREAAYAFAHELYSALRNGGGERGHRGHDNDHGEHHHRHHHRHREGGGYGDLAQRLTALATTLGGSAATPSQAPAPVATPVAETPVAEPAPISTTPATPAAAAAAGNINITININFGAASAPATPSASSPLVDAFKNLLTALGNGSGAGNASPTERLTSFLRQMAESLSSANAPAPATPASGSLLNVSA